MNRDSTAPPSPPPPVPPIAVANLEKWQAYYTQPSGRRPPWEGPSGPASYVLPLLPSLPPNARTLELGCGVGLTSIYLAHKANCRTTAIDLVPQAIEQAKQREREEEEEEEEEEEKQKCVEWLTGDVFTLLSSPVHQGVYDLTIDIQCFHIFPPELRARLSSLTHALLRPGGKALVVVGSNGGKEGGGEGEEEVAYCGPPRLSKSELMDGWMSAGEGGWKVVSCEEGRFDKTEAYGETPPLCWVAVFEKVAV